MTKIIFMGTPAFSATVLEGLLTDEHYDIVAVVTQPDRAVGRKKEIRMTPVKELALAHELPIYQPEKLSGSEEMAQLISLGADGIVTAAYGQFLPSNCLIAWTLRLMFTHRSCQNIVVVHLSIMLSSMVMQKLV